MIKNDFSSFLLSLRRPQVTLCSNSALLSIIPLSLVLFACLQSSRLSKPQEEAAASFPQFCLTLLPLPANMGFFPAWLFACAPSWRRKQAYCENDIIDRFPKNSAHTSSHAGKKSLPVEYGEALAFVSRFSKLLRNKRSIPSILAALLLEAWYSVFEGSHESRVCYTVFASSQTPYLLLVDFFERAYEYKNRGKNC